jgi:O-antigen/teichoic acid export membrane protein
LYTTTAGRLSAVIVDAVYPFLPRVSPDKQRYARHSTTFLQVILFLTIPAAAFVGLEGRYISRVLYGHKWVAMDPLIWPGALSGLATTVFVACAGILLAAGQLRRSFVIQTVLTLLSAATLLMAWSTGRVLWYGWALTVAEICAAAVALWNVAPVLAPRWYDRAVYPPVVATLIAATMVIILQAAFGPMAALWQIGATTAAFSCVAVITCRIGFPSTFSALLRMVPGQQMVPAWLAGDATGA